jgi:hypothetical protein
MRGRRKRKQKDNKGDEGKTKLNLKEISKREKG